MLFANSMIKPQGFTTKRATARFLTMALHYLTTCYLTNQ